MNSENLFHGRLSSLIGPELTSSLTIFFLAVLVTFAISQKLCAGNYSKPGTKKSNKAIRGLEAIPTVQPQSPIKLIGITPFILPFNETLNRFEQLSKKYGDFFKFTVFNQTIVTLLSGPLVRSLLKSTDYGHAEKDPVFYDPMKPFINNGLLVSKGAFWKGQRKILMRSQTFSSLKAYMSMLNRQSKELVNELQTLFTDGEHHQVSESINIAFLKIISEMICGYEIKNREEFAEYHHNFEIWRKCVTQRITKPFLFFSLIWNFHPLSRKNARAVESMSAYAKRRIGEHREKRASSAILSNESNSPPPFRSFLDELIDEGVDEDQIVDEVNGMMFGGHGTGANTIQFLLFALANNPEIQQACQEEIDQLFHDCQQDQRLHFECVQGGLKYLERCILETLRLFTPTFLFFRRLSSPLDIEHQGETIRIPSGTSVAVFPYLTHRKEKYFPDPYKFDPDRFLPEEQVRRHAYAYLPFSHGYRNCPGLKFAMLEMKTVAAYILRNFDISSTDKMGDIPLMPFTTLAPQRDYMFSLKTRLAK